MPARYTNVQDFSCSPYRASEHSRIRGLSLRGKEPLSTSHLIVQPLASSGSAMKVNAPWVSVVSVTQTATAHGKGEFLFHVEMPDLF